MPSILGRAANPIQSVTDWETLVIQGAGTPSDWHEAMSGDWPSPAERLARIQDRLNKEPQHPYLWQLAGFWHEQLNQADESLAAYEKAAALGSKGAVYVQLARQQCVHSQWTKAQENLKRAFEYDISDHWAWPLLVYLHLAQNQEAEMKEAVRQFTELRGDTQRDLLASQLAWLDIEYSHLDHGRAKALAERAVQLDPKDSPNLTILAAVHYRLGETDSARQRLDERNWKTGEKTVGRTWLLLCSLASTPRGRKRMHWRTSTRPAIGE